MALSLPSGVSINAVAYKIVSGTPAGTTETGSIDTSDPSAPLSALVSFPASTGDVVTLTADTSSVPPKHCVGSSMPFAVVPGTNTLANVVLVCGGGQLAGTSGNGNVEINGTVTDLPGTGDNCPQLTSWTVSPLQTSAPGGTIDLAASATDSDVGETLTYAWAPAAKLTNAAAQTTQYHCIAPGADTITLSVTDSHLPTSCTTTISFVVTCVGTTGAAGAGGSGTGGAGGGSAGGGGTGGVGGSTGMSAGCATTGVWADLSGNGHDATLKNFGPGTGLVGAGTPASPYAMSFDGGATYAEVAPGADGLRLTSEVTLEIWVDNFFAEGIGAYNNMYSNRAGAEYSGFFAGIINPGDINSSQWYGGHTVDGASWVFLTTPGRPASSTWTHYVATYSLSQGLSRLYLNGAQVASAPMTAPIVYSATALPRVGGEAAGDFFRGQLGEVRIWAAALSPAEVLARFQAGAPTYGVSAPSPSLTVTAPLALDLQASSCVPSP